MKLIKKRSNFQILGSQNFRNGNFHVFIHNIRNQIKLFRKVRCYKFLKNQQKIKLFYGFELTF